MKRAFKRKLITKFVEEKISEEPVEVLEFSRTMHDVFGEQLSLF